MAYERVMRVLVTVDEDWLTDEGQETMESGWDELDKDAARHLRMFDSGGGPHLRFIEWEGEPEATQEVEPYQFGEGNWRT